MDYLDHFYFNNYYYVAFFSIILPFILYLCPYTLFFLTLFSPFFGNNWKYFMTSFYLYYWFILSFLKLFSRVYCVHFKVILELYLQIILFAYYLYYFACKISTKNIFPLLYLVLLFCYTFELYVSNFNTYFIIFAFNSHLCFKTF